LRWWQTAGHKVDRPTFRPTTVLPSTSAHHSTSNICTPCPQKKAT